MKEIYKYLIFCFLLSNSFLTINAQSYSSQEIKAAFVCNFSKFTSWPKEKQKGEFIIGVIGSHDFGNSLSEIAKNLTIGNRKIKVVYYSNPLAAVSAHVLYVGVLSPSYDLKELLKLYAANNVLTISEQDNFCQNGGMINFSKNKMNYGFEINANYLNLNKLTFSAKLLKLATLVE